MIKLTKFYKIIKVPSKKKVLGFLMCFFSFWILFAASCARMRISDKEANQDFAKKSIKVSFLNQDVKGFNLHYVKVGSDTLPTLFFIHGSPGSWDAFKEYMLDSSLLAKYRMISIDRPGFGYSDFGDAKDLPTNSKLISSVIQKENNNKPLHLIGHSIGGPIVIQLAQDNPNSFGSLTILAGSISPIDEPKEYWRYFVHYSPVKWLWPGAFRPSNAEIIYFKKDLKRLDTGYARITMPVMFIHGSADKFVSIKNVYYGLTKLASNKMVRTIIIPNANHFIPWQHYQEIKSHLLHLSDK